MKRYSSLVFDCTVTILPLLFLSHLLDFCVQDEASKKKAKAARLSDVSDEELRQQEEVLETSVFL